MVLAFAAGGWWVGRESVKVLRTQVSGVWSAAVGVFVHTVTAGPQLDQAAARVRELRR